jgi:uncharacterized membrane protein
MTMTKTALTKPRGAAPALQERSAKIIRAQRNVTQTLVPLQQFESLLKIAVTGGKVAGWGLVSGATSIGVGLLLHAAVLSPFGLIGIMAGMGLYSTRFLRRGVKTDRISALEEELRDLKILYAKGLITEGQFNQAYEKALKNSKIL